MNLSKKILLILLCLVSFTFVFVGVCFIPYLKLYEPCLIVKNQHEYILLTKLKPVANKNKQYQLFVHQNRYEDKFVFHPDQVDHTTIQNQTVYLYQIKKLQTYYNLQKPIYLRVKQISLFETLKQ